MSIEIPTQSVYRKGKELHCNIWPKQKQFLDADHIDEIFYGGAAGGGKSEAILLFKLKRRTNIPGSLGITFRRKLPDLEKSLIIRSQKIFPLVGAKYNAVKHQWKFPNGAIEQFGFCLRDGDVYDHQTAEYQDMAFDELTHFTQHQYAYLTTRVRSAIPGVKALIRSASNPGNVGHVWVKKRFIEPAKLQKVWWDEEEKKHLSFIPALLDDNPSLWMNDPNYGDRLKIVGEKKYKALRFGDWEIFEGQFFNEWDPRPGYGELTKVRKPEKHHIKFISMDWGYANPACILWWEVTPSGRVYIYRELYITKLTPKNLALEILKLCPDDEEYTFLYAPPEIWGKEIEKEGGGKTIQEEMQDVLKNRIVMEKANNARVPGWNKCRQYLMLAPDGFPWLQLSPNVKNLLRTLPAMVHDEHSPEDMDTDGEDHACDAMRYGAVSLGVIPEHIITPRESFMDKVFHRNDQNGLYLPTGSGLSGRSGYGTGG